MSELLAHVEGVSGMEHAIKELHKAHDAFEDAMKKHDCRNGYTPARYAHEALTAIRTYFDAAYRHEQHLSAKDSAIIGAAIQVLKERSK